MHIVQHEPELVPKSKGFSPAKPSMCYAAEGLLVILQD